MTGKDVELFYGDIEDGLETVAPTEKEEKSYGGSDSEIVDEIADESLPLSVRLNDVFVTFWSLGFLAFGGPQDVAILRDHLVIQREWMDEDEFTELFAISQAIPGPASTQLVVAAALARAGPAGGLLALLLWTLPGLIILTTCGVLIKEFVNPNDPPFYLIGLPPAAISMVFKAFYGFGVHLNKLGIALATFACIVAILLTGDEGVRPNAAQYVLPLVLLGGGLVTTVDSRRSNSWGGYAVSSKQALNKRDGKDATFDRVGISISFAKIIWLIWAIILVTMNLVVNVLNVKNEHVQLFEKMFRLGSVIFGGENVVVPMLKGEVVPRWMTDYQFFQGLGLVQSLPGPLFNFASYIGVMYKGISGGLIAFVGLYAPGVMLVYGMVPIWAKLRHEAWFQCALTGINATAIGFVGAACIITWESVIHTRADVVVFVFAGSLASFFNVKAPFAIISGGIVGAVLFKNAASLGQVEYCEQASLEKTAEDAARVLMWFM